MDRVLGAVRQSKTRDKAISPAAQRRAIQSWTDINGGEVVWITEDLSTSGNTSCFKRAGLGPWLTEVDKVTAWDVLVVTRLDRACRNVADFLKLSSWCDRNCKKLIVLDDPSLDTSTAQGHAKATMRATFAQLEHEICRVRNQERYNELTQQGKWTGGRLPYGWRYHAKSGHLVPDVGGRADILREMADMSIRGLSNGKIAKWLNESGHLTVIGRKWLPDTVRRVLRAETTQELLGDVKTAELRAALRSREQNHGARSGGHMLLRVAYCRECGAPLYGHWRNDRRRGSYRCLPCGFYLPMDKLEGFTERSVLHAVGGRKLWQRILMPSDDQQAAIHALEKEIGQLQHISGTEMVISAKRAEIENLKSLRYGPDNYHMKELDITVAEHWATLDRAGKGSFLREWGVRVEADHVGATLTPGLLDTEDFTGFPVSRLESGRTRL